MSREKAMQKFSKQKQEQFMKYPEDLKKHFDAETLICHLYSLAYDESVSLLRSTEIRENGGVDAAAAADPYGGGDGSLEEVSQTALVPRSVQGMALEKKRRKRRFLCFGLCVGAIIAASVALGGSAAASAASATAAAPTKGDGEIPV